MKSLTSPVLFGLLALSPAAGAQVPPSAMRPLSSAPSSASTKTDTALITEVTRLDFTKRKEIVSSKLSVFGVSLGDSVRDAKSKFERAGLAIRGKAAASQFSVYGNDEELLGLDSQDERISRVALFSGMARYLVGEAARLFDPNITEADSALRLSLLGREDSRSDEVNSIGHVVICSYDKEGIRLIRSFSRYGDARPVLHWVPSAKKR